MHTLSMSRGLVVVLVVVSVLLLGVAVSSPVFGGLTPQTSGTFRPEKTYDFSGLDQVNTFNGGLTLQIPLGMRYQSGAMSYGLTLAFNSAKWQTSAASPTCDLNCIRDSRLSPRQNAGAGWSLSLGGLHPPSGGFPSWNGTGDYLYYDALGGEHSLFWTLHERDEEDPGDTQVAPGAQRTLYTREGPTCGSGRAPAPPQPR